MAQERTGVATAQGNPLTLVGPELKVGDKAPDFKVSKNLIEQVSLADYAGKVKLISYPIIKTATLANHTAFSLKKFNC